MEIDLLYLADPSYGGWVTFTAHLIHQLISNGNTVRLFKIKETKNHNSHYFGYGVYYSNINANQIKLLKNPIITAIDKNNYMWLKSLHGAKLVIHDPTELKAELLPELKYYKIITIRSTVKGLLQKEYNIESKLIHHPFKPTAGIYSDTKSGAVSVSRIDFDKHTEIILMANAELEGKIKIYGKVNTMYEYHKLKELAFRDSYYGEFDKTFKAINKILSPAKYMVDMSAIKKDGGGTQYTFLEAIDNDCVLILNEKWFDNGVGELKPNYNCLTVKDHKDLINIINGNKDYDEIRNNAENILREHTGVEIL